AHGDHGLRSQLSVQPAFLLAVEGASVEFATGRSSWEAKRLPNCAYVKPFSGDGFSIGWNTVWPGEAFHTEIFRGSGDRWEPVHTLHPGSTAGRRTRHGAIHLLTPAQLPVATQGDFHGGRIRSCSAVTAGPVQAGSGLGTEEAEWSAWWHAVRAFTLPAHTRRRVLVDLEDYVCAWPEMDLQSGRGARVQVFWAESLYHEPEARTKGNRADIDGKYFVGIGDTFLPDGPPRHFRGPFIRAGRYLELQVSTADEPLVLGGLRLRRAEYPVVTECSARLESPTWPALLARCRRTLRASCHDGFIDGPYYEQMAWIGDIPQDALAWYTMTSDDRPVRKALCAFDRSRVATGLTRAQWPSRNSTVLPGFSLHWIGILHDFVWWRRDGELVRSLLPGQRAILEYFLSCVGADGLLRLPFGWCFADWVPQWAWGNAPCGGDGVSALFHWQLVWTLQRAAVVEDYHGEPELAARNRRRARELAAASGQFWNEARGLYADTTEQTSFSEHVQSLALLSGMLPVEQAACVLRGLLEDGGLMQTTVSYSHYLFEALRLHGRVDRVWERLGYWLDMGAQGFLTTPEGPEPARSDCHGWGAHPHYHFYATLLGIQPGAPGFRTVRIVPCLGPLRQVEATLPHPDGMIHVQFTAENGHVQGAEIALPEGVTGTLHLGSAVCSLSGGRNVVDRLVKRKVDPQSG
ncbi:MAG: alpha-L-rhamnosidase, partial [Rhodospirillales bacterium]|nr:alpha-L-rhamnosidase [Acetobacter sp.]